MNEPRDFWKGCASFEDRDNGEPSEDDYFEYIDECHENQNRTRNDGGNYGDDSNSSSDRQNRQCIWCHKKGHGRYEHISPCIPPHIDRNTVSRNSAEYQLQTKDITEDIPEEGCVESMDIKKENESSILLENTSESSDLNENEEGSNTNSITGYSDKRIDSHERNELQYGNEEEYEEQENFSDNYDYPQDTQDTNAEYNYENSYPSHFIYSSLFPAGTPFSYYSYQQHDSNSNNGQEGNRPTRERKEQHQQPSYDEARGANEAFPDTSRHNSYQSMTFKRTSSPYVDFSNRKTYDDFLAEKRNIYGPTLVSDQTRIFSPANSYHNSYTSSASSSMFARSSHLLFRTRKSRNEWFVNKFEALRMFYKLYICIVICCCTGWYFLRVYGNSLHRDRRVSYTDAYNLFSVASFLISAPSTILNHTFNTFTTSLLILLLLLLLLLGKLPLLILVLLLFTTINTTYYTTNTTTCNIISFSIIYVYQESIAKTSALYGHAVHGFT